VSVDPIFHEPFRPAAEDDGPGTGVWSISLLDSAGQTLFTRYMDVRHPVGPSGRPQPRAFVQVLPWHAFTRRVVIREGTQQHWARDVPPSWPSVALVTPTEGERWIQGATYHARWTAEDPQGLPLAFLVDLSPDDGLTWRPVGSVYRRMDVPLETAFLPGCTACRLRVRASNGILMSEALGEAFTIEAPAPVVEITAPADGASLPGGEPIWLEGLAYDATDGPLGAGQVAWRSDRDGPLGNQPSLQTLLSVGTHGIQLTARNSLGREAIDEITLDVVPANREFAIYLPWTTVDRPDGLSSPLHRQRTR
jgi:hypothetical protein